MYCKWQNFGKEQLILDCRTCKTHKLSSYSIIQMVHASYQNSECHILEIEIELNLFYDVFELDKQKIKLMVPGML